jgi:small subunit ribosomal protein S16
MLAIRMQRTGRRGHAMFRMVVQDARRTPTSGNIVASLGSYDPHAKTIILDKDKAGFYLEHGAKPSERAARLLKNEGVKLPKWLELEGKKSGKIRNLEKLRRNRPAGELAPAAEPAVEATETPTAEAAPAEAPVVESNESPAAEPEAVEPTAEEPKTDETPAEAEDSETTATEPESKNEAPAEESTEAKTDTDSPKSAE